MKNMPVQAYLGIAMLAIRIQPLRPIRITRLPFKLPFKSFKDEGAIGVLNHLFGINARWLMNAQVFHPFKDWSPCLSGSQDAILLIAIIDGGDSL